MPPGQSARVACVQYKQKSITSFAAFAELVSSYVKTAAGEAVDILLFPELFSLQLLSLPGQKLPPKQAIEIFQGYVPQINALFQSLVKTYPVTIIDGSMPLIQGGQVFNVSTVYHRNTRGDGCIETQAKIHVTPNESDTWGLVGGQSVRVFETDVGPIGILICYDSEFPELARCLVDAGALLLLVPFCTDDPSAYYRVRHSCAARAIENQCYVALAGNIGYLPGVENMDAQYGQSAILSPCDSAYVPAFSPNGVLVEAHPDAEGLVIADVDLAALKEARKHGSVQNLNNRRRDLYSVEWRGLKN